VQILLDSSADDQRSRLVNVTVRIVTSLCGEVSDNLSRVFYGLFPRFANNSAEPKSSATSFIDILGTSKRRFFDFAEFLNKN